MKKEHNLCYRSSMNQIAHSTFFIVYPVGLEDLGLIELRDKFSLYYPNESFHLVKQIPGGLEIECSLFVGLRLNSILRCPTRLLLRLGEFKCRDAPKLFQKISKFPWASWLIGQTPEVESSATNSRLFDSRKIEKAIQDGVLQYYRHKPTKKKYLEHLALTESSDMPKIYFRSVEDLVTLSLDTTGERLHLRGEKTLMGLAPIRENLAALLLMELKSHLAPGPNTLVDPMCGSGTFLKEAYDYQSLTLNRKFAFSHTPIYLDSIVQHTPLIQLPLSNPFTAFMGYEKDAAVTLQAQKNCDSQKIKIQQADLCADSPIQLSNPVVVINPPYGVRIGERSDEVGDINLGYYLNIIKSVKNKFSPKIMGIIIPKDFLIKSNGDFNIHSARLFKNGGIDVVFYVLGFK